MIRRLLLIFALALFTLTMAMAAYFLTWKEAPKIRKSPLFHATSIMDDVPGLESRDMISGNFILVNFWASWCPACLAEMPYLAQLGNVVEVVGVLFKDSPHNAITFLRQNVQPFSRIGNDEKGLISIAWGVLSVPTSFLVKDGIIIDVFKGPLSPDDIVYIMKKANKDGKS